MDTHTKMILALLVGIVVFALIGLYYRFWQSVHERAKLEAQYAKAYRRARGRGRFFFVLSAACIGALLILG